jgi:hypothetical protein
VTNSTPYNPTRSRAREQQRPRRLHLIPPERRPSGGGKLVGRGNAGRPVLAGISLPDTRHHIHVLGPTGTGKTTLLLRMILDDVAAGRGVAVFDPSKGDLIRDLLDRLPADCGDRLVIIDPDEQQAPPALNLLDPAAGSPHQVAAHVTSVMAKVWSRWWGHRTADIAYHGVLTLAHLSGATLADLPRLLSDRAWRTPRVRTVVERLAGRAQQGTLEEFWEGFNQLPPGARSAHTAPLLSKLRLVLAHPLAASLFGVPAATFTLADILDGGILLVRLPKGTIGEDGCRLIGSLLLAGLWQATTARAAQNETDRLDASIVLDECHNFLHLPIGVSDALAEARGLHVSFTLAHQYLGQLTAEMREAIDANARNKIYFALAPGDAVDLADHVKPWLDAGDLTRLGGFEVVLRPIAHARPVPPCTLTTLPPPSAQQGRSGMLRAAAAARTGLPLEQRADLAARHVVHAPSEAVELPDHPVADSVARPARLGPALQEATGPYLSGVGGDEFEEDMAWTTRWP